MHNSCNIHSIANSYTIIDKLHRAGDHLSITGCRQPTNYGCSSFHPTIGTEAFILITLATPVPSHDITREFSHFSRVLPPFFLLFGSCSLLLGKSPYGLANRVQTLYVDITEEKLLSTFIPIFKSPFLSKGMERSTYLIPNV
jgi:hypothetical protein